MARSCGPEMSALVPLLGDKQTSGERVENDAIDPQETFATRTFANGICETSGRESRALTSAR